MLSLHLEPPPSASYRCWPFAFLGSQQESINPIVDVRTCRNWNPVLIGLEAFRLALSLASWNSDVWGQFHWIRPATTNCLTRRLTVPWWNHPLMVVKINQFPWKETKQKIHSALFKWPDLCLKKLSLSSNDSGVVSALHYESEWSCFWT